MRHYCSVSDDRYLPQLLAMYESLIRHSSVDVTLHVLALNEACAGMLKALNLPGIEIDANLFRQKTDQTWQEFCWSCASQYSDFLLNSLPGVLPDITYLDADLFFFSDPEKVFDQIGERSIAITPHRLIPSKKHLEVNGKYNVGWVTFRNTGAGRECLSNWASMVRNKCSATDGCGDQLYMDSFPNTYGAEVCELGIGVNVAPWNLANWTLTEGPCVDGERVACFHAHEYIHGERMTNYYLRPEDVHYIYEPYIHAVNMAGFRLFQLKTECQWETA